MARIVRTRRRTLLLVVGIAVGALVVGLIAGTQIRSAADAAGRIPPPEASLITVPVELRTLETRVVTRGDASFAGAVQVEPEVGGDAPAVVTGQVPEVGAELDEGDVLIEITGRPVIILAGELPMYRSLAPGMSGPDVEQLEQTLRRLGLDPGTVDTRYTAATGQAVARLFQRAGYPAPEPDPDVAAQLDAARDAVADAEDAVTQAERALRDASAGPSESERVAAQNEVDRARRALDDARREGDPAAIADAEDALEVAEAQQRELLREPDTSLEQAALEEARDNLDTARRELSEAQGRAGTPLPAAEVVYVETLPRRVDEVLVERGDIVDGPVMSISGADLNVTIRVDAADHRLLSEGMTALIDLPGGGQVEGTITTIRSAQGEEASGFEAVITPEELSDEQVRELREANVRVTIPINSTEGDVLAVPLAALTAGPGGEARVEVQREGGTELVEVEVGLSAEGYAEVTPVGGTLAEGDLVVVGRSDGGDGDGGDDT